MRNAGHMRRAAYATIASLGLAAPATALTEPHLIDLGQARAGTIDDLEIEARNASCDEPQNFRFVPHDLPWLKLVHGASVRNVARGKSKLFVARIDLSGLDPGRYAGRIEIVCETCSDFVLSRCRIDVRSLAVQVQVIANGRGSEKRGGATIRATSD